MNKFAKGLPVLLLLLLAGCRGQELPAPELLRPASARMEVALVDRGPVAEIVRRPGLVRLHSVGVYFENPVGVFGGFYVGPGEEVHAGQLLARMNTEHLETQISEQEEALDRLREDNTLARALKQLDIEMLERDQAPRTQLEQAHLALTHAGQRHQLAETQAAQRLDQYRQKLANARLYAPIDGIVTNILPLAAGASVSAFAPLIFIGDPDTLHIEVYGFTTRDFPYPPGTGLTPWIPVAVMQSQRITAHTPGGVFEIVYRELTPAERSTHGMPLPPVYMKAVGEQPAPGELAGVHFYTAWAEDVVRVPSNALFQAPGVGFYVYRVVDGQFVHTNVEVGVRGTTYTEITGGLAEGDEIFVRP